MTELQDRLARLSPEQRALLLDRLDRRPSPAAPPAQPAIRARPRPGAALPLSFGQRRLWFLHQLEPASAAYSIPMAVRLDGRLDLAALERSLTEVVRRHEVLRTTYAARDGQPLQIVAPAAAAGFSTVEVPGATRTEQEERARQLIAAEVARPFDLANGPVLRAVLLRIAPTDHILLLTAHHIATDGWSMGVLTDELAALYGAYAAGKTSPLADLPLQYADYAIWQAETLRGEALERPAAYWRHQLDGAPAVVTFPPDRPRPATQSFRGGVLTRTLPPALADGLGALSHREGCTLFMTLLAAFQSLLFRYTGQPDVVVGSPVAGRTRTEIEGLIGFFVNTLVLRAHLDGDPSFRTLLQRVRAVALGAFAHQALPFEKLVEELQPERDPSYNPLFQVLFALQNTPSRGFRLPGLTSTAIDVDTETAQLDLSLFVWEAPEGLVCRVEYNADLFEAGTANRLLGHYETLLAGIVADPEQALSALPLLAPGERQRLLVDWNATRAPIPESCVHDLVAAQAARTPEAVAVHCGPQRLTFRELDRRANQLAHHLRALGVGPDVLVGVCMERTPDLLVGLLGILKAGGAYLPLDPVLPHERLRFMLEDSRATLLLTQRASGAWLPDAVGEVPAVCVDADWTAIAQQPETPPAPEATPDNLMYVLYTSGSTGRPKGVQVEHRAMVNLLATMRREPGLDRRDLMLALTTLSFDIAGLELFLPLTTGARIVLVGRDVAADGVRLRHTLASWRPTVVQATPATWRLLLEAGWQGDDRLTILCGGEPMTRDLARQLLQRCGALWNLYGPTETTVYSTGYRISEAEPQGAVPIGRPIANTRLYVLDDHRCPVPVGVPGELYLAGAGLARGYLNRPDLTQERYVPDPFAPADPGAKGPRMYRTGDLARYRPDGNVELLGRLDHQVKIRGFRIELGEIEAVLEQHGAVGKAVVLARQDAPGDRRLVAYVTPREGQRPAVQDLRTHLKAFLPDYMVPAAIVPLASLPLTPNGKVDRQALPAPERATGGGVPAGTAPRTPEQARIAAIWSASLGIESIGIDDDFFDLGGESFKAIQVVRQIGEPATVMDLFKHRTVRRLAEHLAQRQSRPAGLLHELTPSVPAGQRTLSLVCVPYAGGNAIAFHPLASALPPGHSLFALQLPGHDFGHGGEGLAPLEDVARRCVEEIRRDLSGPIALYGHCLGGALTVEIAHRLEEAGIELAAVFVGGHFPAPRPPGKLFEWHSRLFTSGRWTSNRSVLEFLNASGFFTDVLAPDEQDFVIRAFRHDARGAEDYYTDAYRTREPTRLRAPIVCMIGARDRTTELYQERYQEWSHFSRSVELAVIPGAGHYFLKHQAGDVARLIAGRGADGRRRTGGAAREGEGPAAVSPLATGGVAQPDAGAAAPGRATGPAPSLRPFLLVALGQVVSFIGTGLTGFAAGVWVYQRTGSVSAFALISVAVLLPAVLLAPVAGTVADRWDRRRLMMASDGLAAVATAALATLLWSGNLQIWHVYLIASVGAIANAFQQPAYTAAITQLVPKRYYGRANGVVQLGGAAGMIVAPLLGGALVLAIGLHGVVLIDLATFLFALTVTAVVRFPATHHRRQEEPFLREVLRGWQYIIRRRGLAALIVFTVVVNYLYGIMEVLTTPLALSVGSPAVLGAVAASVGAGLLIGGVIMSIWGGTPRRTDGIIGATALFGVSTVIMGLRPEPLYPALGLFGTGVAVALINAHWLSIVQTKVGLELQGRVMATNLMLVWSMMPVGFLTAGPLVDRVFQPLMATGGALAGSVGLVIGTGDGRGTALLLIVAGTAALLCALAAYHYRPIRQLEDTLPDAIPEAVIPHDKDLLQAQADQQLCASRSA